MIEPDTSRRSVFGVHRDLRRQVLVASISSAVLVIAGLATLLAAWWSPSGQRWLYLLVAAAFLYVAYTGLVIAPRWYRHASRVVASVQPTVATIILHLETDSDSRSLYVSFATYSSVSKAEVERFPLVMPRWRVDSHVGTPIEAKVYRDPSSQRPVAFEIASGLLWCIPYARAV
jgi:hypothetical protein